MAADQLPQNVQWKTVVNNQAFVPGTDNKLFNSYNQPSVNSAGYVVMRARAKGPDPMSGIYTRNMLAPSDVLRIADRDTTVPAPNNTIYPPDNLLSTFNEFPSIPRIAAKSQAIATRGNSKPVWSYQVGGEDIRVGTAGIYLNSGGSLITGVGLLGAVPAPDVPILGQNYFPYMAVPGVASPTRFDVFPGSPAVTDQDVIVFKGNYTVDGEGKTGVFFRETISGGGVQPVQLIANSDTVIPNLPAGVEPVTFGSTAPPSAAGNAMVFLGLDNEDQPRYGGIYLAPLVTNPTLTTLIGIGDAVPNVAGATFTKLGEGLSFDGRYVGFWGAWGEETTTLWLDCPEDGNADLLAYCENFVGDNFPVEVPANQGMFVIDTETMTIHKVADNSGYLADFLFWGFSGAPPGVGGGEEDEGREPPRWRSAAFISVSGGPNNTFIAAFKARSGEVDSVENNYLSPVDGIYLADKTATATLLDTSMDGQSLDPSAPLGSKIATLGIEREGFRGSWLAITASMVEQTSEEGMAGVYTAKMYSMIPRADLLAGRYVIPSSATTKGKSKSSIVNLNKNGNFSGRLVIGGDTYKLNGKLNAAGQATQVIKGKNYGIRVGIVAVEVSGVRALDIAVTGRGLNYNELAVYRK